jgi:DNA recombination protein RmuC
METTALIYMMVTIIILIVTLGIILVLRTRNKLSYETLQNQFIKLEFVINKIESSVKEEVSTNRREANSFGTELRKELSESIKGFSDTIAQSIRDTTGLQKTQLEAFANNLTGLTKTVEEKMTALITSVDLKLKESRDSVDANAKSNRVEQKEALEKFGNDFKNSVDEFLKMQKDNFFSLLDKQDAQNKDTSGKLDAMRETIEKKLSSLQDGNEKKLEEMRLTVDEKLEKTLDKRLGESFKMVSERLEAVHKGLGDMQQLATGVGDLKKVLSNVKTRGVMGEYQLANILEQLLTPDQFSINVKTKSGSNALVEFAVKLPGKNERDIPMWLPIDSKFPKEDFEALNDAYDIGIPESIEERRKLFIKSIKKCAADIRDKYIDPPNTTDFAILFLPFESLYAEVLRTPGLFESLQSEYRIIITGPTTLSALLSSLQMGFRTLAIEQRSSEVWNLLGAVKTEFKNFGIVLDKTHKKLTEASNTIESAGVRSRAIERKLKLVQELPKEETMVILQELPGLIEEEEDSLKRELP